VYEDELVRVLLAGLNPPDLASYRDAGTLDRRIAEQEGMLERERRILVAAENSEQIRREKAQLQQECDRARRPAASLFRAPGTVARHCPANQREEQSRKKKGSAGEAVDGTSMNGAWR
jgi:hypothetical protein